MLAGCQRFPQKVNVSVMGCGNINDIHRRIRTYILKARKHLLHTVFFRKGHCLLRCPVHDTIQFLSSFSIACASSFAMAPQPALTQFAILFSAFLSTRLILIHLCIRFIDDLTDIHTTAFCPAHSTGDRHLALTVFLLQCSTDRLYH